MTVRPSRHGTDLTPPGTVRRSDAEMVGSLSAIGALADLDEDTDGGLGRALRGLTAVSRAEDHVPAGSPGRLTQAERQVVAQAVLGYSNQEIARRLYITVSTVEQHLTRAYRKLDIRSRSELRSTLRQRAG